MARISAGAVREDTANETVKCCTLLVEMLLNKIRLVNTPTCAPCQRQRVELWCAAVTGPQNLGADNTTDHPGQGDGAAQGGTLGVGQNYSGLGWVTRPLDGASSLCMGTHE